MRNGNTLSLMLLPWLASCAWLEPKLEVPSFLRGNETAKTAADSPAFVAPSELGSWQVAQARVAELRGNWWEMYNDAQLNDLMAQAMADSPSLQMMVARVKQARAQLGLANSQLFPIFYADGSVNRQKLAAADIQQADGSDVKPMTTYRTGLNASYEVDLFGRLSGEARQARFASLAQSDLLESTKLSLQADVVQAYYAARASAAVMNDVSESLSLGERNLALTKRQREVGDVSAQTYQQAMADLMSLRNTALDVQQQHIAANNRLAYLLGKVPGSILVSSTALQQLPPMIPAGVPASVLERRPDVAAAQNQLAAANAGIGAARAAFFPMISLTASAGYAAQDVSNLFKSSTSTWSFGPALTLPIFQGATNLSRLRNSWGVYEEAVAAYKDQVLFALRDADDALSTHRISLEQANGQQQAVAELEKSAAMAVRQYELGDISLAELNSIKQQALVARMNGQQSLLNAYTASAQLVRALGGGWQ